MLSLMLVFSMFGCGGTDKTGEGFGPGQGQPELPEQPEQPSRPGKAKGDNFKRGPVINPVNFESGSAEIKASEMPSIEKAIDILKDGKWKVMVVGLADASGDPAMNRELTQKRCDAVAAELRKRQIADTRILEHPIGERLATDTNNERQRKVEFVFYTGGAGMSPKEIAIKSRVMEKDFHGAK